MCSSPTSCRLLPGVGFVALMVVFMIGGVCVASFTSSYLTTKQLVDARSGIRNNAFVLSAKKKGFGESNTSSKKKSTENQPSSATFSSTVREESTESTISSTGITTSSSNTELNAGQKALEKLRRDRAEQKDIELRKVRELLQADEQASVTPAAIPEKVANRMGQRMLPFVGLPLFLGMGTFVGFWYFATYKDLEFQPALVATSTIVILVVGLLGITYSVMSASWDPDREGSILGMDEFKQNMKNIQQGFDRSKENAILRDKMSGLSEEELKQALNDLEKRDKQQLTKNQSLQNKLKNELE